jgi:hypothetical protein
MPLGGVNGGERRSENREVVAQARPAGVLPDIEAFDAFSAIHAEIVQPFAAHG